MSPRSPKLNVRALPALTLGLCIAVLLSPIILVYALFTRFGLAGAPLPTSSDNTPPSSATPERRVNTTGQATPFCLYL